MPKAFRSIVKKSLTDKVSSSPRLIAVVVLCNAMGCNLSPTASSIIAPKSTVIAQSVTASVPESSWLNSATLSYARQQTAAVKDANETPVGGTLQVLGVRYPHPDGHKDRARVELVIAELGETSAAKTWHARLGQTLGETLPGIKFGTGIRQANAIDLPLAELQQLLIKTQPTVSPANATTPIATQIQFTSEVNGHHSVIQTAPVAAMEQLLARVARDGLLIGYSGSAAELQQQLAQAAQVRLANSSNASSIETADARSALIPLPPVITR